MLSSVCMQSVGASGDARLVFDEMGMRDIITWTAMITGCAQNGHKEEAFEVFRQMRQLGMNPDRTSLT